jgi:hypothetical protein
LDGQSVYKEVEDTMTHAKEAAFASAEPSAELVSTLTVRLKEALAQAETTDFRAIDQALFDGVTSGKLETFSRDQLHQQLVFALAETVLSDGDAQASDWVVEAVRLFLVRLAAACGRGSVPTPVR